MSIRPANDSDLDGLVELQELLDEHVARSNPRLWPAAERRRPALEESLRSNATLVLVAEEEGKLIAYMSGKVEARDEGPPRTVGYILWAYVREEWRSRGVGTALVAALLDFFESHKAEDISLRYAIGNTEGESFWRSLGFRPLISIANARPSELREKIEQGGA